MMHSEKQIRNIIAFACAVCVLFTLAGCLSNDKDDDSILVVPFGDVKNIEFDIKSIQEDGEWVIVSTTYGVLRYPFAFSDIIHMEPVHVGDYSELRVFLRTDGDSIPIYSIYYNTQEGTLCGYLQLSNGKVVSVSAALANIPADLPAELEQTFYAAQETFNDVLLSMTESEYFKISE